MKVVITHTDFRLYWPSRILALQEALEARGDELYTIEIAGSGSPYAFSDKAGAGARPIRNWICLFPAIRMEDIPAARAFRVLLAKLHELKPDVILSGSIAYPSGATAVYWAKTNHKPVIIFDDIKPEDVPRNALVNYIKKLIYSQVDAVLCPAAPWTQAFLRWHFRREQLFFGVDVVDNGFWRKPDPKAALPGEILAAPMREMRETQMGEMLDTRAQRMQRCLIEGGKQSLTEGKLRMNMGGIGLSGPYFLAVGRQIPAKNFLLMLQAYAQYRAVTEGRDCLPLVMIGEGPERQQLEAYIKKRGINEVYLLPFVNPEVLRTFYHQAAALVLPSRSETWGLVVNEAMAAGLPVLVSRACGCAAVLVEEGVNGYTFSPNSPDQLLEALLSFTKEDAAGRAAMGRASERLIRPWGLDQFVKGSLEAIHYAMANRKACQSMGARLVLKRWKGRYRPM